MNYRSMLMGCVLALMAWRSKHLEDSSELEYNSLLPVLATVKLFNSEEIWKHLNKINLQGFTDKSMMLPVVSSWLPSLHPLCHKWLLTWRSSGCGCHHLSWLPLKFFSTSFCLKWFRWKQKSKLGEKQGCYPCLTEKKLRQRETKSRLWAGIVA